MICSKCGNVLLPGDNFCNKCGTPCKDGNTTGIKSEKEIQWSESMKKVLDSETGRTVADEIRKQIQNQAQKTGKKVGKMLGKKVDKSVDKILRQTRLKQTPLDRIKNIVTDKKR